MKLWMLAASLVVAMPAAAQDFGGMASDSLSSAGSFAGTVGVNSHVKGRSRAVRGSSVRARQQAACAGLPQFRAQHGSGDERVQRLTALCREGGYLR